MLDNKKIAGFITDCYEIGEIRKGEKKVVFRNHILFET